MQSRFTEKAEAALKYAERCARSLKQGYVGTEHILVGLLKDLELSETSFFISTLCSKSLSASVSSSSILPV